MTMQNPLFTSVFPGAPDPALDATTQVVDWNLLNRFDTQIRGLQQFVASATSIAVSGSATLTPAQIAAQDVVVTGAPSGAFTLTLPTTAGVYQRWLWLNETGQTLTLAASTGGTTVAVAAGTIGIVRFDGANLWVLVAGGGGGGGGGRTLLTTLYATPGSPITRVSAWMTQPFSTASSPGGFTAPSSAALGDEIDALDSSKAWGTNAFTFNGGSYKVEDPFRQVALASTWVSPKGFTGTGANWLLLVDSNVNSDAPFWKAI